MWEAVLASAAILGTVFAGMQVYLMLRRPTDPPISPSDPAPTARERVDWEDATAADTASAYDGFLYTWPNGHFADDARSRLAPLTSGKQKVEVSAIEQDDDGDQFIATKSEWLQPGESFRDEIAPEISGPEMVVVAPGTFMMGTAGAIDPSDPRNDERPAHRVIIDRAFAVGKYPVTFAELDKFYLEGDGKKFIDHNGWGAGRRPAIKVTWERASQYVDWLSEQSGQSYRLLSEAEWEYCCRAGTETDYATGAQISKSQACFARQRTDEVGNYPPNAFGLYDMHGNVSEWCADYWHENYGGAPTDGSAWLVGGDKYRITRGGNWDDDDGAWWLRSSARWSRPPQSRDDRVGFRVARELLAPGTD